ARLDAAAVPNLLACLGRDDARACDNVVAALNCLVQRWQQDTGRLSDLANRMRERFAEASAPGQQRILELAGALVQKAPVHPVIQSSQDLLIAAARATNPGVRAQALALAAVLLERAPPAEVREACRQEVRAGLADGEAANRVRAVQLTVSPALREDTDLLGQ